jgi:hypothetical protein
MPKHSTAQIFLICHVASSDRFASLPTQPGSPLAGYQIGKHQSAGYNPHYVEARPGPYSRLTIRPPASLQRSSIACWLHRGFLRLSAPRSLNTSMKKSQALTATAKHRYNDLPLVCQARVLTKPERTRTRILRGRDASQRCVSMNFGLRHSCTL